MQILTGIILYALCGEHGKEKKVTILFPFRNHIEEKQGLSDRMGDDF